MKRVLAIDTSTWWGGAALVERRGPGDVDVVVQIGRAVRDSHASRLLGWIGWLLAEAGWTRSSLDGYAATRGPGAFTGIRVGLGTVQGLALASGRPCVGVGTLEALAEAHGPAEADRLCALEAGRGEVYAARYDPASSPPVELQPPWVGRLEADARIHRGEPVVIVMAAGNRPPAPPGPPRPGARRTRPVREIAAGAGRLALLRPPPDDPAAPLAPFYLRPSDAESKAGP